jgi:hypothetical protein
LEDPGVLEDQLEPVLVLKIVESSMELSALEDQLGLKVLQV